MQLTIWPNYLLVITVLISSSTGFQTSAGRPNDLNFTAAQAQAASCDQACQTNLQEGIDGDVATFGSVPFDSSFYATAPNFTNSQPGALLKLQQLNETTLDIPPGTSFFLMQYTSVGLNGSIVPATAFVALPFSADIASNQSSPIRLVAFAHGTIGYVPSCAPSSSYNGYDYFTWEILSYPGYGVVATDYAGLGNNYTTHKYGNPVLNGNDVYYSVVAAREAFSGTFTNQWAAIGHSQGAGAVWGLSENPLVASNASGKYLGGVAVGPSARLYDILTLANPNSGYWPMVKNIFDGLPFLPQPNLLTPTALNRTQLISELQLCFDAISVLNEDLPAWGLVNSTPAITAQNGNAYTAFQNMFGAATGKKVYQNLLVVNSVDDQTIVVNATLKAWNASCSAGNSVHLSLYTGGLSHTQSFPASSPEWLQWLDNQFTSGGTANATGCSISTATPFVSPIGIVNNG
ncbi:hypothetical protein BGW36DRAFT_309270 [Talaromyces proteolyticus]|uniref:AB hydrolase-1 domain-containing protein n=1 Tax=Talaromyces proteolyticus TaxID=1131652 RepID=A0AAD4PRI4_9EURO|nr:uncharacterized protein BGW36DRAFT_309270 [Talaromyces proteolyticus]KAH8688952.1 hypothetical protein BGW36DRAFT_309270 [Talaromyces proteolyticus]